MEFHDLSVKAIPPPPPPPPAPVVVETPPAPVVAKVYTGEEVNVRPPATIVQELPRYPGLVPKTGITGSVAVVIDEKGAVESAAMVDSVTGAYDKLVLAAASGWQFRPALLNGAPVKFRKQIQIKIAPGTK